MQLWNDYEGKTIAEVFSLGPLLRPEGRSALFLLAGGAEAPAVIRLTEALNDECQMLECWQRVTEVRQENLVRIKRFGQTNFEGTPLTYAVMEVTDANLADILKERPLTYPEAMQVATSVAAALTALHAKGLVHEHIYPVNVLAAGETVKLRTDCVREIIVDPDHTTQAEYLEIKRRDVQDFASLLLQSLTLEKKLSPTTRLPAPFDAVVANGLNGAWGLPEISAALNPPGAAAAPGSARAGTQGSPAARAQTGATQRSDTASAARASSPNLALRLSSFDSDGAEGPNRQRVLLWSGGVCVLLLILTLMLHLFHHKAPAAAVSRATVAPAAASQAAGTTAARAAGAGSASAVTTGPGAGALTSAGNGPGENGPGENRLAVTAHMQAGWYVIAYTYNHEDQAWKKVASILKRHSSLHPEVVAPSGHAPFLIALGGAMSRSEAESALRSARRAGMPRDTFVRNYRAS